MNRVRALAMVAAVMLMAVTAQTARAATPVGQWAFDEGAGTTVADTAGTHPMTLKGALKSVVRRRVPSVPPSNVPAKRSTSQHSMIKVSPSKALPSSASIFCPRTPTNGRAKPPTSVSAILSRVEGRSPTVAQSRYPTQ